MAVLEQPPQSGGPLTGWDLPDSLPPAGTHLAVCLAIKDTYDLERPTFDDPTITEKVNVCRFLFGLIAQDGIKYMVSTREMKISAHEKANLFQFLYQWLGHPPIIGMDTMDMVGRGAQLTIGHETSRKTGRTFPAIATVAPVMDANKGLVPDTAVFPVPTSDPEPQQPTPQVAQAEPGQPLPEPAQPAQAQPAQAQPAQAQPAQPAQPTDAGKAPEQQNIFTSTTAVPDTRDQPPPF